MIAVLIAQNKIMFHNERKFVKLQMSDATHSGDDVGKFNLNKNIINTHELF